MSDRIFLDNNAGSTIDPRIIPMITQHLQKSVGNPSSLHTHGQEARAILSQSRHFISQYFQVKPNEIIFTSGGTEGLNMVLRGICSPLFQGHIITSSVEHPAVHSTVKYLETLGVKATYLEPGLWGAITPEAVENAIRSDTCLIALMAANNETGVKTDIQSIAFLANQRKIPLLVDGVAWLGKEPIVIPEGVSALCFSGYKFHAPRGIGFAYIRSSLKLSPLLTGGLQEYGRRAGTENLPGIVGMAEALKILDKEQEESTKRMAALRDKFEKGLMDNLPGISVNGLGPRICNTANISFEGVEGETLLAKLDMKGISVSHGSACASGALEPSRVLLNMGLSRKQASSALRFSLSRFTTDKEMDATLDAIIQIVAQLRK
jgi:cysteine desulfurase